MSRYKIALILLFGIIWLSGCGSQNQFPPPDSTWIVRASETPRPTKIPQSIRTVNPLQTSEPVTTSLPTSMATIAPTHTPFPTPATHTAPVSHRIGVRVVNGNGEFYDRGTGEKFIPRGNNSIVLNPVTFADGHTALWHTAFSQRYYDPEQADQSLRAMHDLGYNVVRVFVDSYTPQDNVGDLSDRISTNYVLNLIDFLNKAKENQVYVMLTLDGIPGVSSYYSATLNACSGAFTFTKSNLHYLTSCGVQAKSQFAQDFVEKLMDFNAPLDSIFAYSLENELYFESDKPPLSLKSGLVKTANGRTYDMANIANRRAMMDENLVYFIDETRASILSVDPTALVTVGFFEPKVPNPARENDPRVIRTYPAIAQSSADFIDLHVYPGEGLTLLEYVENFELQGLTRKPILMGEFGAFTARYANPQEAAQVLQDWQVNSCQYGFAGWLLWTWDTYEQANLFNALSASSAIGQNLAPKIRPDPCRADRVSIAFNQPVTASHSLTNSMPWKAVDGSSARNWSWESGSPAPQWIEIDLTQPAPVDSVRLIVSQSITGTTTHRVWARTSTGHYQLVHEFSGLTQDGDVLEYNLATPLINIRFIKVETIEDPSPVGWRDIQIFSRQYQ